MPHCDPVGLVHSLESFGSVDGPGVRFVVFLQGCALRCKYCHNPETWSAEGGTEWSPEKLFQHVWRYRNYWGKKGGITVSGGEPLRQMDFLTKFFQLARAKGVHTALDTAGQPFQPDDPAYLAAFDTLMASTSLVILDLKEIDPEKHRQLTGRDNANILAMARHISDLGVPLWIRHVLKLAASYIEEVEKTDTVMGKIRRYVSQHLADEDLSRGDIAGYVYLNPDYLTRIVKKETGLPISEYIQRERMEAAMKLIDKTELSISSVAAEVGYQHFSHFSKVFRKHTGMSPMEYRSRQK